MDVNRKTVPSGESSNVGLKDTFVYGKIIGILVLFSSMVVALWSLNAAAPVPQREGLPVAFLLVGGVVGPHGDGFGTANRAFIQIGNVIDPTTAVAVAVHPVWCFHLPTHNAVIGKGNVGDRTTGVASDGISVLARGIGNVPVVRRTRALEFLLDFSRRCRE
jgi:hypothetical protein